MITGRNYWKRYPGITEIRKMGKPRRKAIAFNLAKAKSEILKRGDWRPKARGAKPKGKREPRRAGTKGEGRSNKKEEYSDLQT